MLKQRIPNMLTVARIVLSPVFIGVFLLDSAAWRVTALVIALLFEITDLLDGYLARRWKVVSEFGKWVDPVADKVAHFAVFFAFLTEPFVQQARWVVFLVFALYVRDTVVYYVRIRAARSGQVLAARWSGKLKTAVQGMGIVAYMLLRAIAAWHPKLNAQLPIIFYAVMFPMVITSLGSMVDYLAANREVMRLGGEKAES